MKRGVNLMKIKGQMTEKGLTQRDLADMLGMSTQTLNKKLNGKIEFVISEASEIIKILGLEDPTEIFFNNNLHNMQE